MKKIVILIVLTGLLFSGCNIEEGDGVEPTATPEQTDPDVTSSPDPGESEKIMENFLILVDNWERPAALHEYISSHIAEALTDDSDKMVLTLEEMQQSFEAYYQQLFNESDSLVELQEASADGLGSDIVERVEDEDLKSLLSEVFDSGYRLESREGDIYPVVDYSFLTGFNDHISSPVKEYFKIMAVGSDSPAAADAEITVSWDEIALRMLNIEAFMDEHPDFIKNKNLERMYDSYMEMYLYGLPNTQAYDNTGKYKEAVIESYNDIINENESSATAKTVKAYLDILDEHDNMISEEARDFPLPQVDNTEVFHHTYLNRALSSLLPLEEGYTWSYAGFAEYGHMMTLDDIDVANNEYKYVITGKVADMSGGESGRPEKDFQIDLAYVIKNAALVQEKEEKRMMDSEMDSLELIKAPLIKGFKWFQTVVDENGDEVYLNCEITDVSGDDAKSYIVEYKDQDSDYYERRVIEEGIGVVSFEKLWETEGESYEIGYSLNREASGN